MSQVSSTTDSLNFDTDPPKLSSTLNVLTILTFIGCGLLILLIIATPALNDLGLKMMDKATAPGNELSAERLADIEQKRATIELYKQNMIPMMSTGIVGVLLCFVGALWMRKLKKDGYWLYLAGQVVPIIASVLIMGAGQFKGFGLLGLAFPIVFIILYTTQRKYLVM